MLTDVIGKILPIIRACKILIPILINYAQSVDRHPGSATFAFCNQIFIFTVSIDISLLDPGTVYSHGDIHGNSLFTVNYDRRVSTEILPD